MFTMEGESNEELAFLDTLLKRNYVGSLHILANTNTTVLTTKQVVRKVLFIPCSLENITLSPTKMTSYKEKQE